MTKVAESRTNFIAGSHTNLTNEESCIGCWHCDAHTHTLTIGPTDVEVDTGLFTCRNPKSDHYTHVFTKDHRMCGNWD